MANQWGIPKEVEEAVLKRDYRCVYCGSEFGLERAKIRSWEHIINDINIATIENIALCCMGCNASKGSKLLNEWLDSPKAKLRGVTERTLAPVILAARDLTKQIADCEMSVTGSSSGEGLKSATSVLSSQPVPKIHLYHCVSARSFRPLWLLEELQLPYTLHMLPFPPRARARSFLELNPLGTVPLLLQGEVRMTESAAICQYLAAAHPGAGLEVRPPDPAFGAYLNWLHMSDATLTFPQTLVLRYGRFEPADRQQPQVVEDYSRWFLARLRAVEAVVAHSEYLCAGRFTAADVAVGYALLLAQHLGLAAQFGPATQSYWHRLQQRPGYQRAMAAQVRAAEEQGVPTTPAPDTKP